MMLTLFNVFLITAAISTPHAPQAKRAVSPLLVEQLYNTPGRPLMVQVEAASSPRPQLALTDAHGVLLAEPVTIRPGRLDLAEVFPRLWNIRETAYVQVFVAEEATGAALVLQPMLSPLQPRTDQDVHPTTGDIMTRIVGWDKPDPRVFSGFRAYPEQDVLLNTTHGEIRIALRPDHAPNTVWNFMQLTNGGLYEGLPFHRIVPLTSGGDPFVIQSGDPSGTGTGGPGFHLPLEPSELQHDLGVISMARADEPDSAGSQFFICLSRAGTSRLDGQYAAFGYAVDGLETILAIADVELADVTAGRPADPPRIVNARLVPAPPRVLGRGRPDERVAPPPPDPTETPGRVPR